MPRVNHFEIMSEDPEKTIAFCSSVFDWTFRKWSGPFEYWLIKTGDPAQPGIDGGLSRGEPVQQTVFSMDVPELDPLLEKAVKAEGTIVQPKDPIPGVGWFAAVRGPDGNLFGLMEEDPAVR